MGLNETVSAERLHIGFFGVRNAGKSSLVNAVTGQDLAVVSDIKGTTTDPVKKTMELLPLGPVVIIDTPGLDDEGELGAQRVKKARQILAQTDIAVLVIDSTRGRTEADEELISLFEEKKLPYLIAYNKADLLEDRTAGNVSSTPCLHGTMDSEAPAPCSHENTNSKAPALCSPGNANSEALALYPHKNTDTHPEHSPAQLKDNEILVSAATREGIHELKEKIGAFAPAAAKDKSILADLLDPGDIVVLVIPVDEAAPKGRLILPQQQTMREILDIHCTFITCQPEELKQTLADLSRKPKLVVTDSQAFRKVAADTPDDVLLTSFSILFARYKGSLPRLVEGAAQLSRLKDGDKVLISEGCTHHRQCSDIGTVKLPHWIEAYSGAKPVYTFTSGTEFPEDLSAYTLVVHCGGCMLNEKEMKHRIGRAVQSGVPIVNYGIAIACMNGILKRSLQAFPDILAVLENK